MKHLILSIILFHTTILFAQNSRVTDSLVLVDLYHSTNGGEWTDNTGWLESPLENWFGITIGVDNNRVTLIELFENNLAGQLPFTFTDLDSLQDFNFGFNKLYGFIPILHEMPYFSEIHRLYYNPHFTKNYYSTGDVAKNAKAKQTLMWAGTQRRWSIYGDLLESPRAGTTRLIRAKPGEIVKLDVDTWNADEKDSCIWSNHLVEVRTDTTAYIINNFDPQIHLGYWYANIFNPDFQDCGTPLTPNANCKDFYITTNPIHILGNNTPPEVFGDIAYALYSHEIPSSEVHVSDDATVINDCKIEIINYPVNLNIAIDKAYTASSILIRSQRIDNGWNGTDSLIFSVTDHEGASTLYTQYFVSDDKAKPALPGNLEISFTPDTAFYLTWGQVVNADYYTVSAFIRNLITGQQVFTDTIKKTLEDRSFETPIPFDMKMFAQQISFTVTAFNAYGNTASSFGAMLPTIPAAISATAQESEYPFQFIPQLDFTFSTGQFSGIEFFRSSDGITFQSIGTKSRGQADNSAEPETDYWYIASPFAQIKSSHQYFYTDTLKYTASSRAPLFIDTKEFTPIQKSFRVLKSGILKDEDICSVTAQLENHPNISLQQDSLSFTFFNSDVTWTDTQRVAITFIDRKGNTTDTAFHFYIPDNLPPVFGFKNLKVDKCMKQLTVYFTGVITDDYTPADNVKVDVLKTFGDYDIQLEDTLWVISNIGDTATVGGFDVTVTDAIGASETYTCSVSFVEDEFYIPKEHVGSNFLATIANTDTIATFIAKNLLNINGSADAYHWTFGASQNIDVSTDYFNLKLTNAFSGFLGKESIPYEVSNYCGDTLRSTMPVKYTYNKLYLVNISDVPVTEYYIGEESPVVDLSQYINIDRPGYVDESTIQYSLVSHYGRLLGEIDSEGKAQFFASDSSAGAQFVISYRVSYTVHDLLYDTIYSALAKTNVPVNIYPARDKAPGFSNAGINKINGSYPIGELALSEFVYDDYSKIESILFRTTKSEHVGILFKGENIQPYLKQSDWEGLDTVHIEAKDTAGLISYGHIVFRVVYRDSIINSIDTTTCNSVEFGGSFINETGTYYQTFETADFSDSLVVLNLTILEPVETTIDTTIAFGTSFLFNGAIYAQTSSFAGVFTAADGCDSTVTVNLTVLDAEDKTTNLAETACVSFDFSGVTLTESGEYRDTLKTVQGADSIVVLNLTILEPVETTIDTTIAFGTSFLFNGATYSQTSSLAGVFTAADGCDSTVTVNLTVSANLSPVFKMDISEISIPENSANGTKLLTLVATDPEGHSLHFFIGAEGSPFSVDENSGVVSVTDSSLLDYESAAQFTLAFSVSDGTDTVSVTVTVVLEDVAELTTSVENATGIRIYPTISDGMLFVEACDQRGTVRIFSKSGSLVFKSEISGFLAVNTVDFSAGTYTVTVRCSGGEESQEVIVKK